MRCNKCGAEFQNGVNFCSKCGMVLTCPVCKKPVPQGSLFCGVCGASVSGKTAPVQRDIQNVNTVKKKSNTGCVIAVIVGLIILLLTVVAAVAGYFIFRGVFAGREDVIVETTEAEIVVEVTEYNPPVVIEKQEDEYLFPSDVRYITRSDLNSMTREEVAYIRNEIYARHGYIFKNQEYQSYFESKSWYSPNPYFDESDFNSVEKVNKDFIVEYEESRGWR